MRINDSLPISMPAMTGKPGTVPAVPCATVPVLRDLLRISEAAQQKIDQLQQGNQALEQALVQSRRSLRNAAMERVTYIREYLKILARISPAGDRGAASEAARLAREIKQMAHQFKGNSASGEEPDLRKETAGFMGVAGEALNIARELMKSYLRKRAARHTGDTNLAKDIGSAISTVREIATGAMKRDEAPIATNVSLDALNV